MSRRKGTPCACECDPCNSKNPIRAINNVSPEPNGDFTIEAGNGIGISAGENKITIINQSMASSFVAGDNIEINPSGDDLEIRLKDNVVIGGDLTVNGTYYTVHAEHVYTEDDYIIMRDGATTGLGSGDFSGVQVKKYDGTNDGRLVIDNSGTARVGDVGDEQPLLTREESANLNDGALLKWDAGNSKAVDEGTVGSDTKPIKIVNGVATPIANDLVSTIGSQTIVGNKTFNNGGNSYFNLQSNNINVYQRPNDYFFTGIQFIDVNGVAYMQLRATYDAQGSRRFEINIRDISGNDHWTVLASRTD